LGRLDGLSAYVGPRLLRPPSAEARVLLPLEIELIVPAGSPSYRNFATGMYETDVTHLIRSIVLPKMTVVDLGANIGYYTLLASRLVGAPGRVYAFEPEAEAYSYLARNVGLNQCENVVVINKAAGSFSGTVNFIGQGPERGFVSSNAASGTPVEQVSLDAFFAEISWPPIDVVKMDTEGTEEKVLLGMASVIERNPGLRIIMELNTAALAQAGSNLANLIETLQRLGFDTGYIIEQRRELQLTRLLPGSSAVHNLLLCRQGLVRPNTSP
jgi:FkbM family methyltransferase